MGLNGGGYAMAYGGSECYTQTHSPTYGMSKPQKGYGMAETWDEYGQSCGNYKSQKGPAMPKTQLRGPGNREGRVYGYGSPVPPARLQRNGRGTGHGFGHHGSYEITEAYGYEETNGYVEYENHGMGNGYGEYANNGMGNGYGEYANNGMGNGYGEYANNGMGNGYGEYANNGMGNGYGEYANNGMGRSHPQPRGKHSGHGNGVVNTQSYGPAKTMGFEYTEAEYFSNQSEYYGGGGRRHHAGNTHSAKGLIGNNSGKNSCSDSDSDDDDKGWNSKAI